MNSDRIGSKVEPESIAVALLGIPSDTNSSFQRGAAAAPAAIRQAMRPYFEEWGNPVAENGVGVVSGENLIDVGNVPVTENVKDVEAISGAVADHSRQYGRVLCLGGDHFVTYPILRGIAAVHGPPTVLHFDAHPDIHHEYQGNRLSHASPFARIMEEKLASRLVQVGIRSFDAHQDAQIQHFGVESIRMSDFEVERVPDLDGPLYISLDLDALDPAFAPGVSHPEPGGLSVREILAVLRKVRGPIVGADIVELNPARDIQDRTAIVAAKFVKEFAGRMLEHLLNTSY